MAAYKAQLAGFEVKIHNVDHEPPHCHTVVDGWDAQISLFDVAVRHPPPYSIPSNLRRALREEHETLLKAWDDVTVIPPGSSPGQW